MAFLGFLYFYEYETNNLARKNVPQPFCRGWETNSGKQDGSKEPSIYFGNSFVNQGFGRSFCDFGRIGIL